MNPNFEMLCLVLVQYQLKNVAVVTVYSFELQHVYGWTSCIGMCCVSQKAAPKTFCDIFTLKNYLGCCPTIFPHVYRFWSIYLHICTN